MNPEIEQGETGATGAVVPRTVLSREETLRRFFLGRLEYLIRLRDGAAGGLKAQDDLLIKRALYSTYRDCVSLGSGDEARALLKV
ncbi:MAG TPA: hypothetical protein VHL09_12910 [Dehalococcoidia bacterium]|nr:hypothetical protein [Dehalococcoidia bacterium]